MEKKITELVTIVEELKHDFRDLSDYIYMNPELGYMEHKSSKAHMELLVKHGFEVESEYMNLSTAFKATYTNSITKDNATKIAYLSEYDALPKLGHACGHHLLGMASTGAAIALSKLVKNNNLDATIVVFGTPAEETSGAKVMMAEKGCFDGIDVALLSHPGDDYYESGRSLALRALEFEFFGKASHAASNPEGGRNALDAVINTFNSINALRQQIKPTARIHGIIKDGGTAPNIIPEYTNARFYLRASELSYLNDLVNKVNKCAEYGAYAAGCTYKVSDFEASYANIVPNKYLSKVFNESLHDIGVSKIEPPRKTYGSIDAGNVSQIVPTIHPYHKIAPKGVAAHTLEFAKHGASDYAFNSTLDALKALALTGYKIIENPDLLDEIKKEFNQNKSEGTIEVS